MKTAPNYRRRAANRQGYLYVAVLFTTLIVATLTTTGLVLQSHQIARHSEGDDWIEARHLAESAVSLALARINDDSSWRTTYTNGQAITAIAFANGSIAFPLHDDADNNLADDPRENIRIRGIGTVGASRYAVSVQAEPTGEGIEALGYSLASDSMFDSWNAAHWSTDGKFGFNGQLGTFFSNLLNIDWNLTGNVEYRSSRSGGDIFGTLTRRTTNIEMPASNWSDYYLREGTLIDVSALPWYSFARHIENTVISPNHNPWGATNRLGIYVIDCGGQTIQIHNCRVEGTLVLLNTSEWSKVTDSVYWNPAVSNFPALLVDGDFALLSTETPLSEAALNVNFNPSGFTASDNDVLDTYPSRIRGLVCVHDQVEIGQPGATAQLQGSLICDDTVCNGDIDIGKISGMQANPPPGFRHGPTVQIIESTWKRETGP